MSYLSVIFVVVVFLLYMTDESEFLSTIQEDVSCYGAKDGKTAVMKCFYNDST